MNLQSIEYFMDIIELGTYHAAAEKNNISQSSLSKIIKQLEYELGFALFTRVSRNVQPSEAGKYLYTRMDALLKEYYQTLRQARFIAGKREIRGCIIPAEDIFQFRQIRVAYTAQHPEVNIFMSCARTFREVEKPLNKGDYTFAIMHQPLTEDFPYDTFPLCDDGFVVLIPKEHRLSQAAHVELADLRQEKLLVTEFMYDTVKRLAERAHIRLQISHIRKRTSVLSSVLSGQSITIFRQSDLYYYNLEGLAVRPLEGAQPSPLMLVIPLGRSLNEAELKFLYYLIDHFAKR